MARGRFDSTGRYVTGRGPTTRVRWRHWHVEGRDFGYRKAEAAEIAAADARHYGFPIAVERCDIDHSGTVEVHVGYGVYETREVTA